MKKCLLLFGSLLLMSSVFFMSCSSDDDDDSAFLGAKIKVEVDNALGIDKNGVTVYMYKDKAVTKDTKPGDADKNLVTNSDGVATFDLNFTELKITESQTTLYFAVFYTIGSESYVAGSSGVTVKRNEVKDVKITTPL